LGLYKWKEKEAELEALELEAHGKDANTFKKLKLELLDHKRLVHFLAEHDPKAVGRGLFDEDLFEYPSCPADVVITPARAALVGYIGIFHGPGRDHLSDQVYLRDRMMAESKRLGPLVTKEVFFSPSEVVVGVELINAPGADSMEELSALKEALDDADRVLVVTTSKSIKDQVHLHDLLREHVIDRVYRGEVELKFVVNREKGHRDSGRRMLADEANLRQFTLNTKNSTKEFMGASVRALYKAQDPKYKTEAERLRLTQLVESVQNHHVVVHPVLYMSVLTNEDT
jgi:hypothetical protein